MSHYYRYYVMWNWALLVNNLINQRIITLLFIIINFNLKSVMYQFVMCKLKTRTYLNAFVT